MGNNLTQTVYDSIRRMMLSYEIMPEQRLLLQIRITQRRENGSPKESAPRNHYLPG